MKISLHKIVFWLLMVMPFSPKIEIVHGLRIFPQDLFLLPLAIIYIFSLTSFKFDSYSKAYFYLLAALFILSISTLYSLFAVFDFIGLVKTIKYIFYVILIIAISKYHFNGFLTLFNRIALITVSATFLVYAIDFIDFTGSVSSFLNASVWMGELIPTGLYNMVFSLPELKIYRSGGTHGIYGSYLVIVFLINYVVFISAKNVRSLSFVLMLFTLLNILLLTSRETFVLLVIVILAIAWKDISRFKLRKTYIYALVGIIATVIMLIYFEVNIGILNKITHTVSSFQRSGTEGNIHHRVVLWTVIAATMILSPLYLLIGTGYNITNFQEVLADTAYQLNLAYRPMMATESFFLLFLVFGGLLSFIFALLFWGKLITTLRLFMNNSLCHYLFFYFTIGLVITNNTGGSMLSDMFMVQYALVYFWLIKSAQPREIV